MKFVIHPPFLYAYRIAKSTGLLEWEPIKILVEKVYFFYKRYLEAPGFKFLQPFVKPDTWVVDVGANIGLYSLWATVSKSVRCFSFEPESLNFSILNRNIFYNNLVDKVTAYPLAVSDQVGFDFLHLSVFESGESCHSFASNKNFAHQEFAPAFSQGSFSTTIDHLVETSVIPTPNHIKIDVDGIENKVINGARKILERPELKSMLIEINDDLPCDLEVKEILKDLGFILTSAPPSVLAPVKSVHNIICRR